MRKLIFGAGLALLATSHVAAVSVWELSRLCGKETEAYCKGVAYGDAMTECIEGHYAELSAECQGVVDRLRAGEGVSIF